MSRVRDFVVFVCCELWGMAKIEWATDKVIKGRDQETDKEAW